jgi:endonuclease/exonuclease/phosphatase family metal-dependent hydrolase
MKGTIHQEEIPTLNIHAPNPRAPIYIKKKKKKTLMALRAQTDANTVIVGDLNNPPSSIDRSSRQKINKETSELLHTLERIEWLISTKYSPNN